MHKPYTYYIAWPEHDLHYYGVRFAKDCSPDDLWVSYFTSSKRVKNVRKIYGEPSIVEVRKIFETTNAARLWESRVIKRLKAPSKKNWLNMSDHNDRFYHEGPRGPQSEEHKRKRLESRIGWKLSEDHKVKLNQGRRNSKNSPEHTAAVIASRVGSKHSEETRKKMSESRKKFYLENPDKIIRRSWTDEQRKANGDRKRGKKWTSEQKARHSERIKRMWAERKKNS